MKPIDELLSKHCGSCIDKAFSDPEWDKDASTRYVCGEREELTGNLPCTVEDVKKCSV